MKGKHLKSKTKSEPKQTPDYETQIKLIKHEKELLQKALDSCVEEIQRLRLICELNGVTYSIADKENTNVRRDPSESL